jgi:hypothetical protein
MLSSGHPRSGFPGVGWAPEWIRDRIAQAPYLSPIGGLLLGMLSGLTTNAFFGLGEEVGWRGLLQRKLAPLGFWPWSLLIGRSGASGKRGGVPLAILYGGASGFSKQRQADRAIWIGRGMSLGGELHGTHKKKPAGESTGFLARFADTDDDG